MFLQVLAASVAKMLGSPTAGPCPPAATPAASVPAAIAAITAFRSPLRNSVFTLTDAATTAAVIQTRFADRLEALVKNPRLLHQRSLSACGTAAFLHIWFKRDPGSAVRWALDLFEHGHARIGSLDITPSQDLLKQNYQSLLKTFNVTTPRGGTLLVIPPVDEVAEWVMISALRDTNPVFGRFLGTPDDHLAGMVRPEDVQGWLAATGLYSGVVNNTNLPAPRNNFSEALCYSPTDNRDVVLLISTRMLERNLARSACTCNEVDKGETLKEKGAALLEPFLPNHYIVLEQPIQEPASNHVSLCFWCWGDVLVNAETDDHGNIIKEPDGTPCTCMPYEVDRETFERHYYGAVIAVK